VVAAAKGLKIQKSRVNIYLIDRIIFLLTDRFH